MITKPTVLVLGAGASYPYGYPLGRDLVNTIVRDSMNIDSDFVKGLVLLQPFLYTPTYHYTNFAEALKVSASPSIDAFLESRGDFIDLGRFAIAFELLRCEKPEIFYEKDEWYHYLYDKMRDTGQFESFSSSKISIVTFNYDRSLEFFLFRALKHTFQKKPAEILEHFNKIPIIHVHGRLGPSPTEEGVFPYGTPIKPHELQRFVNQIKIIFEARDDMVEFNSAQNLLNQAERICFLGFGFHETNLRRLFKGTKLLNNVEIFCSRYGVTDKEKHDIHMRILAHTHSPDTHGRTLQWGERNHGCLEFLRESGVLLG